MQIFGLLSQKDGARYLFGFIIPRRAIDKMHLPFPLGL
jgi:hypothetical protein